MLFVYTTQSNEVKQNFKTLSKFNCLLMKRDVCFQHDAERESLIRVLFMSTQRSDGSSGEAAHRIDPILRDTEQPDDPGRLAFFVALTEKPSGQAAGCKPALAGSIPISVL